MPNLERANDVLPILQFSRHKWKRNGQKSARDVAGFRDEERLPPRPLKNMVSLFVVEDTSQSMLREPSLKVGFLWLRASSSAAFSWLVKAVDWLSGMVTIMFRCELPTFNKCLESSLLCFLAHDLLDGPRQRRAY